MVVSGSVRNLGSVCGQGRDHHLVDSERLDLMLEDSHRPDMSLGLGRVVISHNTRHTDAQDHR